MSVKKGRIFTKWFTGNTSVTGTAWVIEEGIDTWVVEEAIEIVGWSVFGHICVPSENDGMGVMYSELSQSGLIAKDGMLARIESWDYWNTTPAGIQIVVGRSEVVLPEGQYIPVSEGGTVYLHNQTQGKTAGTISYSGHAIVFYRKKQG